MLFKDIHMFGAILTITNLLDVDGVSYLERNMFLCLGSIVPLH